MNKVKIINFSSTYNFLLKRIPYSLFFSFLIFYTIQIPVFTHKADVMAFFIRSLSDFPILNYAYLNSSTLLGLEALPNYHLAHSVALWLIYHIIPDSFPISIWYSGFFSAICASSSISLTYLIWRELKLSRRQAILIAIIFGLVPTFWEHALVGEIHTMQMLFILLFIYCFFREQYILSSFAFLIANLISPLSGLSFLFLYLKKWNKKVFYYSLIVGFVSLVVYIVIYSIIDADFSILFNPMSQQPSERGIIYRTIILLFFIVINFNFATYYIIRGFKDHFKNEKLLFKKIVIASIPQILLIFISAGFFIEFGSFQHLLFWALCFPIGLYLSSINLKSIFPILIILFSFTLTYFIWINPHKEIGNSLYTAGKFLYDAGYEETKIIGPWDASIHIIQSRNGHNLEHFENKFFDFPKPAETEILKTNQNELIISELKKSKLRTMLSNFNIPGLVINHYRPEEVISIGKITKLYEDQRVILYHWEK